MYVFIIIICVYYSLSIDHIIIELRHHTMLARTSSPPPPPPYGYHFEAECLSRIHAYHSLRHPGLTSDTWMKHYVRPLTEGFHQAYNEDYSPNQPDMDLHNPWTHWMHMYREQTVQGNIPEAQLYADYAILACIGAYREHGCVHRAAFKQFMTTLTFLNRMPK